MKNILVIGSSNTDLITNVERFPNAGETISGKAFMQAMGGKGANQAVAAQRLGGKVKFITALGNDANGNNTLTYFRKEGLDVSKALITDKAPTGTAIILVNDQGENCIVVTPGANHQIFPEYIEELEHDISNAAMVVLQMEIPFGTVEKSIRIANKHGVPVLLNVAPAGNVAIDLIKMIDILVVNETEIEIVARNTIAALGEHGIIDQLRSIGARTVILTLGKNGCIVKNDEVSQSIQAYEVEALDTTAAGDTFCGALVAGLSNSKDLVEAIKFATAASAICVTRMGAQPSIPTKDEVIQFLASNPKTYVHR